MDGTQGNVFPSLLSRTLVRYGEENEIKTTDLPCTIIGVFFATYLSKPCREFLPLLQEENERFKKLEIPLEIVYVSLDSNMVDYSQFLSRHSFYSVPFTEQHSIARLKRIWSIQQVPSLILLDNTGKIVDRDGISRICNEDIAQTIFKHPDASRKRCVLDKWILENSLSGSKEEWMIGLQEILHIFQGVLSDPVNSPYKKLKKSQPPIADKIATEPLQNILQAGGFQASRTLFCFSKSTDATTLLKQMTQILKSLMNNLSYFEAFP